MIVKHQGEQLSRLSDDSRKLERVSPMRDKLRLFVSTNFSGQNFVVLANATDTISQLRENIEKAYKSLHLERIGAVGPGISVRVIVMLLNGFAIPSDYRVGDVLFDGDNIQVEIVRTEGIHAIQVEEHKTGVKTPEAPQSSSLLEKRKKKKDQPQEKAPEKKKKVSEEGAPIKAPEPEKKVEMVPEAPKASTSKEKETTSKDKEKEKKEKEKEKEKAKEKEHAAKDKDHHAAKEPERAKKDEEKKTKEKSKPKEESKEKSTKAKDAEEKATKGKEAKEGHAEEKVKGKEEEKKKAKKATEAKSNESKPEAKEKKSTKKDEPKPVARADSSESEENLELMNGSLRESTQGGASRGAKAKPVEATRKPVPVDETSEEEDL
eukprot:TRINITY_DN2888_c0_g2_i1.p1 TRINITY_DN2888_c0_g2~~TRINITY_DN2888_c0_g2_i1.p1  ORF type:complete len:378 (+),score=148.09 TRINITY_DN2888_c0_g2_i1:127-1260(+)